MTTSGYCNQSLHVESEIEILANLEKELIISHDKC